MSETFTNYYPLKINIFEIKWVWKREEHVLLYWWICLSCFSAELHIKDSPGQSHCSSVLLSGTVWLNDRCCSYLNFKGTHTQVRWIKIRRLYSNIKENLPRLQCYQHWPNRVYQGALHVILPKTYFLSCAPKLGSISLIDILDTVAPFSTHILSSTPSAPWLNSPLSHEQREDGLRGRLSFPGFKKISEQNFG